MPGEVPAVDLKQTGVVIAALCVEASREGGRRLAGLEPAGPAPCPVDIDRQRIAAALVRRHGDEPHRHLTAGRKAPAGRIGGQRQHGGGGEEGRGHQTAPDTAQRGAVAS